MANNLYATPKLKQLREAKGMTQEEMAQMFAAWIGKNVSISLVQKWERGAKAISSEIVLELARFYKAEPKDLVERK